MNSNKFSIEDFRVKKSNGKPITMLTAYDFYGAQIVDEAGIDCILVGDSLAMVMLGHPNTVAVTMEEMLHHCRAVSRGAHRAFLIGDMPFLSYQTDVRDAVFNAGRFIKEAGMDAVKLEGGQERIEAIHAITNAGIPVVGHLGLTPQSATKLGGYKVQAKTAGAADCLLKNALALEQAGCFLLVFEMVPARLARYITDKLSIPTIGIGAGTGCNGQVLVYHDMLGINAEFQPKFLKKFADLHKSTLDAFKTYKAEVENRDYPANEHSFKMPDKEFSAFLKLQDE